MERLEHGDPRTLGRYRILARIGAGGMATVYLGRSRGGRAVAVKAVHPELAHEQEFQDRFRREVEATRTVGGVHCPPVLDADPDAVTPWMATEFVPSLSLRETVERFGPLPAGSVRRLAAGLAEALAAVHRADVVHLDVKPANVLMTADGPRLIDFGIATGAQPAGPAGSWGFMSPEQVSGVGVGAPSDVYALGATLAYAHGGLNADAELRALIGHCRRPDPSARPSAAELSVRLARAEEGVDGPDTDWLPPAVMAAIDVQASEADNPPDPPSPLPGRRLLFARAAAAALVVAGGTAAVIALNRDKGSERGKSTKGPGGAPASSPPPASPSPSPSPSGKPVRVEFTISGDGPLVSVTYAVNGRLTTLKDVALPWQKRVEVPRVPGSLDWRLRFTFPSGRAKYRVLVDGSQVDGGSHPVNPAFGYPYDVDTGGSSAVSGPLPNADG